MAFLPDEHHGFDAMMSRDPDRVTRDSAAIIETLLIDEAEKAGRTALYENFKSVEASKGLSNTIDNFIKNRTSELMQGEYEYID